MHLWAQYLGIDLVPIEKFERYFFHPSYRKKYGIDSFGEEFESILPNLFAQ